MRPGLRCYIPRHNGEPVPGCSGDGVSAGTPKLGGRSWDYCYDPRELSRDVDLGSGKMTPAKCMQTVRQNPLCDHTYFNLGDDGKCMCVGPTTDCSDKQYQKKGDATVYKIVTGERGLG